jgi:hypothetical protein
MADYTMSDFLQGRSPMGPSLQGVWQQMMRNGELEPGDLAAIMSPSALGADIAMRQPNTLTYGKGSVQPIPPPQRGLMHDILSLPGRPMYEATRAGIEGRMSPEEGAWTLATQGPFAPSRGVRAPRPAPGAPAPTGPWQPGYMEQYLQGRYQPAARPQAWQGDRRWGSTGDDAPGMTWHDVVAGRLRTPQNRAEMIEAAKGAGAVASAAGGAYGASQFGFDTLYHGEPWQTASWRAAVGPGAGEPPSWWPQPPPGEKPLPPNAPQPPSRSREGW